MSELSVTERFRRVVSPGLCSHGAAHIKRSAPIMVSAVVALVLAGAAIGSPQFVTQWGSDGSGPGQWGNAFGVAVDDSLHVYVVDESHHRIEKFTSTGEFLAQWGTQGTGAGQFNFPNSVAVDDNFNVYVTDTDNNRVQKFTSAGSFVTSWGSTGGGDGQFRFPLGIAVDESSHVYVVDNNNFRVQKFTSSGVFSQSGACKPEEEEGTARSWSRVGSQ